jgi:hypothetical protein
LCVSLFTPPENNEVMKYKIELLIFITAAIYIYKTYILLSI